MNITAHKMIDATEMLKSKFKEPTKTEYQRGWNDALQAAYDVGEPKEIQIVLDERTLNHDIAEKLLERLMGT